MQRKSLAEWLLWLKTLHNKQIDMELGRVREVAKRMNLLSPTFTVITVAGTNGKGSTVAGLEKIYLEAGYRVGAFTSPYLIRFNEEIRLLGKEVSDEQICAAFAKVENMRKEITLTPFEFTTLAALEIFHQTKLDVCILEVGLGGRLDAVNIMDADIAIVTSIDIDHTEYLGDTREKIALEKAGIFRSGKPAISGDFNTPQTLIGYAKQIGAPLYCQNQQYGFETDGFNWNWWSEKNRFDDLPSTQLLFQNMATVLMAVELLQNKLPVKLNIILQSLKKIILPARIQVIEGDITYIYDVSHNPAAVTVLAQYLKAHPVVGKTIAIFSMLNDKDISGTLYAIKYDINEWYVASLITERAATVEDLKKEFSKNHIEQVFYFNSIKEALSAANGKTKKGDRVLVFGSFHTVSEVFS